jgi:hypothetical protein
MSCHSTVTEWTTMVRLYLPHLSTPQATVLALWSLGMVLACSCALTAVATFVAVWLRRQEQTVRQPLRECCDAAAATRGDQRQALGVERYGVPRLAWVLSRWQGTPLAWALEATTLGLRFTVLAIRVVSRGGALPVAWTILPAPTKQAWRRAWLRLLRPAIPQDWTAIVLADRGLSAGWLFRRIVRLGWPPFWRINHGRTCCPDPQATDRPLISVVPLPGTRGRGTGTAFKRPQRRRRCTRLACWEEGDTAPWLLLTDLPPKASEAGWSGLRAWIEPGVNVTKRAGWQGQRTRMTDPQRAARVWLAVAVATLGLLRVGGAAEETMPETTPLDVTALLSTQRRQRRAARLRLVRIFRRGWVLILVAVLRQVPLPLGAFLPAPWPPVPPLDQDMMITPAGAYHHVAA